MRKAFIAANTPYQAQKECPWASHIAKACGGYWCFESYTDYETWKNQK